MMKSFLKKLIPFYKKKDEPKRYLFNHRKLDQSILENRKYHPTGQHVRTEFRELRIKLRQAIDNWWWLVKIHCRFWALENIFKNRPIRVHEMSSFEVDLKNHWDGKPGWLDVNIELPGIRYGSQFRWVFTVDSLKYMLTNKSFDDAHGDILFHKYCGVGEKDTEEYKKFIMMQEDEFWVWLKENADDIFETPIVEFDNIYTGQDYFTEEDVVKYTWFWLKRHRPKLADRAIIWTSWEEQEKKRYEYRGLYGKALWLKHKIIGKNKCEK